MRLDLTRSTFDPDRSYSGVVVQQGRVQVDADANEATAIGLHRDRTTAVDVVGAAGVPRDADAFRVVAGQGDLFISPGRIHVDGIPVDAVTAPVPVTALTTDSAVLGHLGGPSSPVATCQWLALGAPGIPPHRVRIMDVATDTRTVTFAPALSTDEVDELATAGPEALRVHSYTSQPFLPGPPHTADDGGCPTLALSDGVWAAYLDVWERAVTAREDPRLREPALGGPDTTARTQVVWQLRLIQLSDDPAADVACALPPPPPSGGLQARAEPTEEAASDCEVPAGAGYRRLENHLYRVEIHDPGPPGSATFTWSRENGSVVASWRSTDGRTLVVDRVGEDDVRGFGPGDHVELTDRSRELAAQPGVMVQIERVDDAGLHLVTDPPDRADFDAHAVVRRWDDPTGLRTVERPAENEGWLALEDGVEVRFTPTGTHRTGDHWLVPARTATGDVEWPRDVDEARTPLVRRPHGVSHHRSLLALVRRDGEATPTVTDCRSRFPTLTDLHADDVTVHPGVCDLADGATVQDTLEMLCRQRDLRHHNRHLHGWGIVCGLQVSCGQDGPDDDRAHVTIAEGYAIDRGGNDLLQEEETVDLLAMVDEQAPEALDENGDGEVCLNLSLGDGRTRFDVEPYRPDDADDPLGGLLNGTLVADFHADCIAPVQAFLEEELRPPEDEEGGVHPARERLAALTNLVVQPVNPSTGQHVFVSPREHEVLQRFYFGLRDLLRSETFCAMFDDARPFPDYPFDDLGLTTIFGRGSHERLRVRPGGREAYTVGPGVNPQRPLPRLNRYDLERNTIVATMDPLAGGDLSDGGDSGAGAVQDVAFSPDGRLIYIVAPTRNRENSFFRAGAIRGDTIDWQPVQTICGTSLVTLATTDADRAAVYAIGVVDEPPENPSTTRAGLYRIVPDDVDPNMEPMHRFNAVGHLEIAADGQAFATAAVESEPAETYTRVLTFGLPQGARGPEFVVPEGSDDLAIRPLPRTQRVVRVYTVAGPTPEGTKFVVAHDVGGGRINAVGEVEVDNTAIRLEPFEETGMLLVTSEDGYSLSLIDLAQHAAVPDYLLPLQVGPIAVAAVPGGERALVLHYVSNTIVSADARVLTPDFATQDLLAPLADYRAAAIEAYVDLLGGFLQYLKDCLCDKFLVACRNEDTGGALSLACVSIRGRQVYKVCNFSRRRYVKSFPTVGYWLSAVPILPLLRAAFEEFCCAVLPSLFSDYTVPRDVDHTGTGRVRVGTVREGAARAQAFNLPGRIFQARRAVEHSGELTIESLGRSPVIRRATERTRLALGTVVGRPVERAAEMLRDRGLDVRTAPFEPDPVAQLTTRLAGLLRSPEPGGEVTLQVEDDRVRSFAVSGSREAADLRRRVTDLSETVATRNAELAELRAAAEAHEARLEQVATLQTTLAETSARLGQRDEELVTLRERLDTLETRQGGEPGDAGAIARLRADLDELRDFRDRVQRFMNQSQGDRQEEPGES